jgi:hypothetical protein
MFETNIAEKILKNLLTFNAPFLNKNRAFKDVTWKNIVEPYWPQATI